LSYPPHDRYPAEETYASLLSFTPRVGAINESKGVKARNDECSAFGDGTNWLDDKDCDELRTDNGSHDYDGQQESLSHGSP